MTSIEISTSGGQPVRAELRLLPIRALDTVTTTLLIDNTGQHIRFPQHPTPADASLSMMYALQFADVALFPLQGSSQVIVAQTATSEGLELLLSWLSDEERTELNRRISQSAPYVNPTDLYADILRLNEPLDLQLSLGELDATSAIKNISRVLSMARFDGASTFQVVYGIFGAGPHDPRPEL